MARKSWHSVHPIVSLEMKHQQCRSGCCIPHGSSSWGCAPSKAQGWELQSCALQKCEGSEKNKCSVLRYRLGASRLLYCTLLAAQGFGSSVEPRRPGQTVRGDCVYSLDSCKTFLVFLIITLTFLVQKSHPALTRVTCCSTEQMRFQMPAPKPSQVQSPASTGNPWAQPHTESHAQNYP